MTWRSGKPGTAVGGVVGRLGGLQVRVRLRFEVGLRIDPPGLKDLRRHRVRFLVFVCSCMREVPDPITIARLLPASATKE